MKQENGLGRFEAATGLHARIAATVRHAGCLDRIEGAFRQAF